MSLRALTDEEFKKLKPGDRLIYETSQGKYWVKYVSPTTEPEVDGEDAFAVEIVSVIYRSNTDFDDKVGDTIYAVPCEVFTSE